MLTADHLRKVLEYDPATGLFRWLVSSARAPAGSVAGGLVNGYVAVRIDGRRYQAHRLAYLYMTGNWPPADIDHKDRKRANNAWVNLRPATRSQNIANGCARHDGPKGTSFDKSRGKYVARIKYHSKTINLGRHDSAEAAHAAYVRAAATLFGEFARAA